jgi:hypothetical protein
MRVAFITSPFTLSFPDMKSFCAFAFPAINLPKSGSERIKVTMVPFHILALLQHVLTFLT